jgi:hypothetical protein
MSGRHYWRHRWCGVASLVFLLVTLPAPGETDGITPLRTFFSFEREIWADSAGSVLEAQKWERHQGNPVIRRGKPGSHDSHRIGIATLLPEGDRLRLWYEAMPTGGGLEDLNVAYAESTDGITWVKPNVSTEVPGTNIVIRGAEYLTVVPALDGKGFVAAAGFHVKRNSRTGATFEFVSSPDGIRWDFKGKPATDIEHFEMYGLFRREGRWWILGQGVSPYFNLPDGTPHGRVMYGFHAENPGPFEWYPRPLFHYPVNQFFRDAGLQQHVGAGLWDRGRVLLGIAGQFWPGGFSATVSYTLGLLYSYDGLGWTEPFSETPLIMPGPPDTWDDGWLFHIQRPVSRGDRTLIFYTGGDGGNEWSAHSEIGLATIRRDGFAAWKPTGRQSILVTEPLELAKGETNLYLNFEGQVGVQILDRYWQPVNATLLNQAGNEVRGLVPGFAELQLPPEFRLAFHLSEGARLYSFSFGPGVSELPSLAQWE